MSVENSGDGHWLKNKKGRKVTKIIINLMTNKLFATYLDLLEFFQIHDWIVLYQLIKRVIFEKILALKKL